MQRLSEELERQGEAVNHHANLVRQRDAELKEALQRVDRANEELVAMEPPTLTQACSSLEVLLRVSTAERALPASEAGDDGQGIRKSDVPSRTWCLVRYSREGGPGRKSQGMEDGAPRAGASRVAGGGSVEEQDLGWSREHREGRHGSGGGGAGAEAGGVEGTGGNSAVTAAGAPNATGVEGGVSGVAEGFGATESAEAAGAQDERERGGEDPAVIPVGGTQGGAEGGADPGGAEGAAPGDAGVRVDGEASSPGSPENGAQVVIEWRSQEEVDEWFALQLSRAVSVNTQAEGTQEPGGPAAGAIVEMAGDPEADEAKEAAAAAAVVLPVLDMPPTIQELFAAQVARVKQELEAKLEEARAELSRNTEAYNQYRVRVRAQMSSSDDVPVREMS